MNHDLDPQTVSTLLVDAARQMDIVSVVAEIDSTTWGVAIEGVADCLLEMDDGGAGLTLSVDLGSPIATRRADVHSAALTYNALWRETRGQRIAQAGADGDLLLVRQLTPDELRAHDFPSVLQTVSHAAALWIAYVGHDGSGEIPATAPTFDQLRA